MHKTAGLGKIAIAVALGTLALLPAPATAAVQLPRCDGVVLDTSPTLVSGTDSAWETLRPLAAPPVAAIDLPDVDPPDILDPPDITLPGVLPAGVELIDGKDLGDSVLCVDVDRPRTLASRGVGREESARGKKGQRCRNSKTPTYKMRANRARRAVLCLIDEARRRRGKSALKPSKPLKAASKRHSRVMVGAGCFSHQCSGEPPLTSRVTKTGYLPCDCSWRLGENIAYGPGRSSSPRTIVTAWMKSPPHKEIILASFKNADVGLRNGVPGGGRSKGGTFTADFGSTK